MIVDVTHQGSPDPPTLVWAWHPGDESEVEKQVASVRLSAEVVEELTVALPDGTRMLVLP